MALASVNVLGIVGNNGLPNPLNTQGGTYMGGVLMNSGNIVAVIPAAAVDAALAEREQKIEALQGDLSDLKARLAKFEQR
jgi:hypothetical protein